MKSRITIFKFVLFSLAFCLPFFATAQNAELTPKKMKKDLKALKKIIEAHPDPYTHISQEAFNKYFDDLEFSINESLTTIEFYNKVASIVALIRDGHSQVRLPQYWLKKQRKEHGAFPYEMYLTNDDKLYVLKTYRKDGIPVGSKILSINNIPVDSFLNVIDPFISYEKKEFRNTKIDGGFEGYLYSAFGQSNNLVFEYSSVDTLSVKVENMPYQEWKKFIKSNKEEREKRIAKGEPYDYEKISDGVGVIKIFSFGVSNLKDFDLFLYKTFKKIKADEIHSLVIDVRGNFGGWPKVSSRVFQYISDDYFKTMAQSNVKVSESYRNYLYKYMPSLRYYKPSIQEQKHYLDLGAIIREPIGSFINERKFFNEEPIEEEHEFKGDCYLLTDRDSYSAASSFAATFQCYQMGIIIGEETGGTKIFRANAIYEELPRSGLRVGMSTTKLYTACFNEEFEGVKPTIAYKPKIFEITSEHDMHLLFAQRVIKQVQKERKLNIEKKED